MRRRHRRQKLKWNPCSDFPFRVGRPPETLTHEHMRDIRLPAPCLGGLHSGSVTHCLILIGEAPDHVRPRRTPFKPDQGHEHPTGHTSTVFTSATDATSTWTFGKPPSSHKTLVITPSAMYPAILVRSGTVIDFGSRSNTLHGYSK